MKTRKNTSATLIVLAMLWLGFGAAVARASTTTLNFETPAVPGTASPMYGPLATNLYASSGVTFVAPSSTPVIPAGGDFSFPYVYRDAANAHSGKQVLYSYVCYSEACSFGDGYGAMFAQLANQATDVDLYAGATGGGTVELAGYDAAGAEVAHQTLATGTKVATHLQITSSTGNIAYFSVYHSGYGALEIDDLTIITPATPPPPSIVLSAASGQSAFPGQSSALLGVDVGRFNGAVDAVNLHVSGLPTGVTLVSGTTIAANSSTTTLKFSVSASAPLVSNAPFTISATTADASPPPPLHEQFSVVSPGSPVTLAVDPPGGYVPASSVNAPLAPCSLADVTVLVKNNVTVTTSNSLKLTASGDGTGLSYKLSSSSVGPTHGGYTFLTLTVARTSSSGSGNLDITITATNGGSSAKATVVVQRTGLTAQGLYVTQGPQTDLGLLLPSGVGASGGSYLGVQLVSGKKTVVRLYGDASGTPAGQAGVSAQLYGYKNGHPLPGSPLEPDYGTLASDGTPTSTLPDANAPNELITDKELESNANAYTFTLPDSWTGGSLDSDSGFSYPAGATIKLVGQLRAYQSGGVTSSCQGTESFTLNNVPFTEVGHSYSSPLVFPIAMPVKGVLPPPPSQVFQDLQAVTPLPDDGLVIYPYEATDNITSIAGTNQFPCNKPASTIVKIGGTTETAGAGCGNLKNALVLGSLTNLVQNYNDGALDYEHDVGVNLGTARGLTNGVPGQYSVVDGTTAYRPLTSVSHELFHQFGLNHASAACGGAGVSWPPDQQGYLDGIAVNTTSEPYQFIAAGSPDFKSPFSAQSYDLMSYCAHAGGDDPNTWVSPRNWTNLIGIFGTGAAADLASAARARSGHVNPIAAVASVDPARLRVTAFLSSAGLLITNVGPQVGPPSPAGTSADSYDLTARGSHGQVMATVPMAATTGGHIDGTTSTPLVELTGEVPASGVDSIQVASVGGLSESRERPAIAPRVRVLAPRAGARVGGRGSILVRWSSTNPEHLALTAAIDYSRDNGRTWRTISYGPDAGHVSLDSFFFTASREARVRVRVSDGFNQTEAISRRFIALGAAPQVTILTRLAGRARVPADARLQLTGQAIDQAAQVVPGRRLGWFDGPFGLGRGAAIGAGPLPEGVNHIRLVARDSDGRIGSATLVVTVSPIHLPFLKLSIPGHVNRRADFLRLRAGATIPATLTIGRHRYQLGKVRAVSLPIHPGRGTLLLQMSVDTGGISTPFAVRVARR